MSLSGCIGAENAADLQLSPGDGDGDGVADVLEAELCERPPTNIAVEASGLGTCNGADLDPRNLAQSAFLPESLTLGPDADGDLLPEFVTINAIELVVDPFSATRIQITGATTVDVAIDTDDADAEQPAPSIVKVSRPIPVGVILGDDNDNDALPGEIEVMFASVTVDRTNAKAIVQLEPAQGVTAAVDTDDEDASQPVVDKVAVEIPVNVYHTGDGDGDLIPGSLELLLTVINVDRTQSDMMSWSQSQISVVIDEDDTDRDSIVPFSTVDGDGDLLPDAAERVICQYVQKRNDTTDGECVRDDGTGWDGSGDNYQFPMLSQVVTQLGGLLSEPADPEQLQPTSSEEGEDAPGLPVLALLGALAVVAILRRR